MKKTDYEKYAEKKTPNSPIWKNMLCAFLVGGAICTLGQAINIFFKARGLDTTDASAATGIALIFLSILFTGLDVYDKLAKYAGAGTIVPITGFANAIASPAIEFKSEGYILGVGAKMFVVAGPVITYGIVSAVIAGVIQYLFLQ